MHMKQKILHQLQYIRIIKERKQIRIKNKKDKTKRKEREGKK